MPSLSHPPAPEPPNSEPHATQPTTKSCPTLAPPPHSLGPTASPGPDGEAMATPKKAYHEPNARVLAGPAWPLQPCLVGAVAGVSPPSQARHVTSGPCPAAQAEGAPVPWAPRSPPAPPPQRGQLTAEGCGLGLPARFFFEIEGVFMSSRFFLENMVGPAEQPRQQARVEQAGGVLAPQLQELTTSGPHSPQPPPPQLSGPRDRPSPHWRALPPQEKASGGGDADPTSRASACRSTEWA